MPNPPRLPGHNDPPPIMASGIPPALLATGSKKSTDPAPAAPQPAAPPPRRESWRETVESIVFAFVLAFLFRTFEAEAFVIPTGSMAPTLYGQHRDVYCAQCGTRYAVSASEEVKEGLLDPRERSHSAVCPNCRYPNFVLNDEMFKGDRILVNKFPYEFGTPDRWDVIVFKYPEEAKTNYIKRLAGLPGEDLKMEWGDVWVRKHDSQDPFKIPRKRPDKQRELQLLVYDDDHPPRELLQAGWPERWAAEEGSNWSPDPDARAYRADPDPLDPDRTQWLRYRHIVPTAADWTRVMVQGSKFAPDALPRPQLITDFYAYNAKVTMFDVPNPEFVKEQFPEIHTEALGTQWVGDLTVSCSVEILEPAGELTFELIEGERRYRCRVDLKTGRAALYYLSDQLLNLEPEIVQIGEADSQMKSAGTYKVSFSNVDDRVCFWVNNRLVRSVEFDPGSRYAPQSPPIAPTERDLSPVGIAARGAKVRIAHLLLQRDIYYRYAGQGNEEEYYPPANIDEFRRLLSDPEEWSRYYSERRKTRQYTLQDFENDEDDEFFVLGDNSPRSRDSRLWDISPAVPRRLLIGKAFYIYWPHGVPFLNGGKGYAILNYDERKGDRRTPADPPSAKFSIPFYPQIGRMQRIR